jgi:hypothetical protein
MSARYFSVGSFPFRLALSRTRAQGLKVRRLAAGGDRIRTIGPAAGTRRPRGFGSRSCPTGNQAEATCAALQTLAVSRGTDGSNPASSSEESSELPTTSAAGERSASCRRRSGTGSSGGRRGSFSSSADPGAAATESSSRQRASLSARAATAQNRNPESKRPSSLFRWVNGSAC